MQHFDAKHVSELLKFLGTDQVDRFNKLKDWFDEWEKNTVVSWNNEDTSDKLFSLFIDIIAEHSVDRNDAIALINRMLNIMVSEFSVDKPFIEN